MQVKQVLFFQLPPRRLWLWWCGGFHILDAIIVGAMCALGAIWTEQLTIGYFRYIDGIGSQSTLFTLQMCMHISMCAFNYSMK